jgi:hypothetical protein
VFFYGDEPSSIAATGADLTRWGLATVVAGTPLVETDTVTGKTCIRTGVSDSISVPSGAADFLSAAASTGIVVWRTRKFNFLGSSYPVIDTTQGGTVPGFQLLAREDNAFGDFRRFEVRVWDGVAWRVQLPGSQNAGHWIPLKWSVITWRLSATQLDLRIDGRYVDVLPEDITLTYPGGSAGTFTIGKGPSDYQAIELYNSWLSDSEVVAAEVRLASRFGVDLIVQIAGDLRAPSSATSYQGFPGLTQVSGLNLYCTYFIDATESEQPNRIDAKRSTTGGRSWGTAVTVATSGPSDAYANINVTILSNGVWIGSSYKIASASIQHLKCFRSTDAGTNWSVSDVTLGTPVWEGCSGFILEDLTTPGKLYWPVYTQESGGDPHYNVYAYVSTDYGVTWPTRHLIASGVVDVKYWAEPNFVLESSSMYAIVRDAEPPDFFAPPNEMNQSQSTDNGVTWAALETTTVKADSAGQSLKKLASGRYVWLGRPGGRRMAAIFYRAPGAAWNDDWSPPTYPNALWIDFIYGGFGGMSYGGLVETSPGIMCLVWGATTDATHDDVVCRPNFFEWYLTYAMPGSATPVTATVASLATQQVTAHGAGDFVYAFTANPTGSSISAGGLFTAGNTNGDSTFTVTDLNGHVVQTCTYTVTGGSGGFTPPQAANIIAHYRPQDTGTVTASGGLASAVTNLAGASSALTQSSGGLKPAYGTATINSLNVLDFESAKVMDVTIPGSVTDVAVIMVVKDIAGSSGYHGHMGSSDVGGPAFYIHNALMAIYDYTANAEVDAFADGISDGTSHILMWRRIGNNWDFFVDSTKVTPVGNPVTTSALPTAQFVGSTTAASGNPSGNWIGEIYVYNLGLSDGDYATLQTHMKAEWGTP